MDDERSAPWIRLRLSQMRATTELLATSRDLQEALSHLARRVLEVIAADYALVVMFDESGKADRVGESGFHGAPLADADALSALPPFRTIRETTETIRLVDAGVSPDLWPPHLPPVGPFLGAGVLLAGEAIGALYAMRKPTAQPFTEIDELAGATLALQSAANISHMLARERQARVILLEERTRIAGDLHQGIVEALRDVGTELHQQTQAEGLDGPLRTELSAISQRLSGLADGVADYARALQSSPQRAHSDLARDLAFILRQVAPQGIDTVLNMKAPAFAQLTGRMAEDLLFIAREAITNAVRHGLPTKLAVDLREVDDDVALTVQDDGVGFDAGSFQPGLGMTALQNRVDRLNGKLAVMAIPGMGTTVRVTIPAERLLPGASTREI
ncbi:MAG: ATP-binding protein [Dehalococcoidia bacterium]|nr:ATP-binding protein [Dehalococcoidia bacterium]